MTDGVKNRPTARESSMRNRDVVGVKEIRKIPIVSITLIIVTIMLIWAIILAIITAILGAAALSLVTLPVNMGQAATGGIVAIIISLIITWISTFIFVAISAWFYNILAPRIGGIKIDLW